MAITIKYNGVDPFGTRVPFVSRDFQRVESNGYISGVETLTLSGSRPRPSCNATFATYKSDIDTFRAFFSQNFKSLEILENGVQIFFHSAAKISSISIPETPFSSFYRYEIKIDCIESYNNTNIVNPVNQWSKTEGANSDVTLNHTVSARGVGDGAFEKARNFVLSNSNLADSNYLYFTGSPTEVFYLINGSILTLMDTEYVLISRKSSCDRLNGDFSMTETWIKNSENSNVGYGVITYETVISESNGLTTVEINGKIELSKVDSVANGIVRGRETYSLIDFQAIAQSEYQKTGGTLTLSKPVSLSVTEDANNGEVSFNLAWNNQAESSPYIVDSCTISIPNIGGTSCIQYSAKIKSDSKDIVRRYADVKTFFENIDWEARVIQKWNKYGTGETLSSSSKSKSVSYNPFSAEISCNVNYCTEVEVECSSIEAFKYSLSFSPSITKYAADPILYKTGFYSIQNLGFKNRQGFSISGSAKRVKCFSKESSIGEIKSRVNLLLMKYFKTSNKVLTQNNIEYDKNGDFFSFSFSWTGAEGDVFETFYYLRPDSSFYFAPDGFSKYSKS